MLDKLSVTAKIRVGKRMRFSLLLMSVPEPSTFILFAIGSIGIVAYAWRRRMA
jgi:hypothetical protein